MAFAIKADVPHAQAKAFAFAAQKTMYGGKQIAKGDTIFVFASENEGGQGLIARGVVTSSEAVARTRGIARHASGGANSKPFTQWNDGRPETELNFKFYRQATNKIVGISDEAAAFLEGFFSSRSPVS